MNSEISSAGFVGRLKLLIGMDKPYPWAAKIGISQATFNRMWKDGIPPKADILLLISEKTGCSIDWLLTGRGAMKLGEASEKRLGRRVDEKSAGRSLIKQAAVGYIDEMDDTEAAAIVQIIVDRQDDPIARMSPEGKAKLREVLREQIEAELIREREESGAAAGHDVLKSTGS